MSAPRSVLGVPAPAKINRFLHVVGRRADGYHNIQSVFAPIELCDTLDFVLRDDGRIEREGDLTGSVDADLAVRAARALLAHVHGAACAAPQSGKPNPGVTLRVEKRIPVGAGLGGGSSDAAAALIALNHLWELNLPRPVLAQVGLGLGADVPFFLGPGPAFVEGVGERAEPVLLPPVWYVLVYPQVHVSTAEIFADPKLTRDHKRTTIAGFSTSLYDVEHAGRPVPDPAAEYAPSGVLPSGCVPFGSNDLEPVVRRRFPAVDAALRLLAQYGPARMSGSGSSVFCMRPGPVEAQALLAQLQERMPAAWLAWAVPGLGTLPLAAW
jgi:4-diphosphocytidyl-2-C-methyl-D-erythritol kinase